MDAHANAHHPVAPSAVLPDFIFLFIFATIMILTRKTTTEYTFVPWLADNAPKYGVPAVACGTVC